MYKIYAFAFLTILFFSCNTKIRYIGKSLAPTKDIEVFISETSIRQPFEYIGKGYVGGFGPHANPSIIQKKAEKLGREKGADAVLITDYFIPVHQETSTYTKDTIANVTRGVTTSSPGFTNGYQILFLKYNKHQE